MFDNDDLCDVTEEALKTYSDLMYTVATISVSNITMKMLMESPEISDDGKEAASKTTQITSQRTDMLIRDVEDKLSDNCHFQMFLDESITILERIRACLSPTRFEDIIADAGIEIDDN